MPVGKWLEQDQGDLMSSEELVRVNKYLLKLIFPICEGIFIHIQVVHKIYTIFTGGIMKNCIHPENNEKS